MPPMNLRKRERSITRIVQSRISRAGVRLHRLLIRLVVRRTLDVLSEQLPGESAHLLKVWRHSVTEPTEAACAEYARAIRKWRFVKPRGLVPGDRRRVMFLNDQELAAVYRLLDYAQVGGDMAAVTALNKTLDLLRG